MTGDLLLLLVKFGLPVALVGGIWKINARRWTRLARAYGSPDFVNGVATDSVAKRSMQTVFLIAGDIGWNSYKGIATFSVTREGLLLKLTPPFSLFHPPLLIPFADCQIEQRRWRLNSKTFQYTLRGVSDVKMIVMDDLQHWIESQTASLAISPADNPIRNDMIASNSYANA